METQEDMGVDGAIVGATEHEAERLANAQAEYDRLHAEARARMTPDELAADDAKAAIFAQLEAERVEAARKQVEKEAATKAKAERQRKAVLAVLDAKAVEGARALGDNEASLIEAAVRRFSSEKPDYHMTVAEAETITRGVACGHAPAVATHARPPRQGRHPPAA